MIEMKFYRDDEYVYINNPDGTTRKMTIEEFDEWLNPPEPEPPEPIVFPLNNLVDGYNEGSVKGVGRNVTATGKNSFSFGEGCQATGENSVAFGYNSRATGKNSVAFGGSCKANGYQSMASGSSSETAVNATCAVAMGSSKADGQYSMSFGNACHAYENISCAIGSFASAKSVGSVAIGTNIEASSEHQVVLGVYNLIDSDDNYRFIIGNGTEYGRKNAFAIKKDGTLVLWNGSTPVELTGAKLQALLALVN